MNFKNWILLASLAISCISTNAQAGSVARPMSGESRIKIVNYMPNTVFKFVGHYEYQSIIEFDQSEEIDTISMGTPTPWQVIPSGNRIFIKPVDENASTNMTVITNKRMYFFEMRAEEAKGLNDDSLNFIIKFVYPDQFSGINIAANTAAKIAEKKKGPDLSDPDKYNFKYSIAGDAKEIEPLQVFDDGKFTYLKFKNINAELPAIFQVNSDNSEALVNFRIEGEYMVVEKILSRITLRHGADVICVFKEEGDTIKASKNSLSIF